MSRYLKGIAGDLVITYDEIIDAVAKSYNKPTKTVPINFDEKKNAVCKMENFYIIFGFLLITISQLIIVRVIILLR